jgi:protein-disulfide isomerase
MNDAYASAGYHATEPIWISSHPSVKHQQSMPSLSSRWTIIAHHGKISRITSQGKWMSKRADIREMRRRRKQRQQITMVIVVVGIVMILVAIIILPIFQSSDDFIIPEPLDYPLADGRAVGDQNAPVVVEVFEDFQCSACKFFSTYTEELIIDNYVSTGQVRYIFRQYPFEDDYLQVKESDQAANASMCAAEQGRFWDYHNILYTNLGGNYEGGFSDRNLTAFAEALNLDMDAFTACYSTSRYQNEINQDLLRGDEIGLQGTPTVLVNGETIGEPGKVPTYEEISQAIENEIAALPADG